MNIFLGFSFYGAGNIGDDLMLEGFIDSVVKPLGGQCKFFCCIHKSRIASQKLRFPAIKWISNIPEERLRLLKKADMWLGVGGTPFQGTSGSWLVDQVVYDLDQLSPAAPAVMIGVGAELEVLGYAQLTTRICDRLSRIYTRDVQSANILVDELGVNASKVRASGDLAHLALKNIFSSNSCNLPGRTAICFYQEECQDQTLSSLREFAISKSKDSIILFFANEVRRSGFERSLFLRIFGRRHWIRFWLNRDRPKLLIPRYQSSPISRLVFHFSRFDTVLSSRYHALLTAAWAGCRVVGLGRSSKISALSDELLIPLVLDPYLVSELQEASSKAPLVDRTKLEELHSAASDSCAELIQLIKMLAHSEVPA